MLNEFVLLVPLSNLYRFTGDDRPFDLLEPGCANLGGFGGR